MTTAANLANYEPLKSPPKRRVSSKHINMKQVATIILGGGQGTRLFPLTLTRCKPAICFGGRYRLIDVPISNAINAGCQKIFVLTQFLSASLHQHIFRTYRDHVNASGFLEVLTAEQKPTGHGWYQGTADAVRQNIEYLIETPADYFLILSGDQLYNIDFTQMLKTAKATNADLVISATPVNEVDIRRMGALKIDGEGFVREFIEKPQEWENIAEMRVPGLKAPYTHLGSMGMYLFKREALIDALFSYSEEDFGKHLIPHLIPQGNTAAYIHRGYWEDIGTIDSFYKANMALTDAKPPLDCYDAKNPIYVPRHNLPGAKISNAKISRSIICEGAVIEGKEISHSILGPRTVVKSGTIIRDSYLMGGDYYTPPVNTKHFPANPGIGKHTIISKAIIDRYTSIGDGVQLINRNQLHHYDGENIYIRDGIIIVPRGATIPDGFIL